MDSLELQHNTLLSNYQKTAGSVTDLLRGHRKAVSNVQNLQHELEKTNETLQSTRGHLEGTVMDLHEVKGDLGRTNDVVQKLDLGVEFCNAGFNGLRKGFQETGTHIQARSMMLPKLNHAGSDSKTSSELLGPKTKFPFVSNQLTEVSAPAGALTAR